MEWDRGEYTVASADCPANEIPNFSGDAMGFCNFLRRITLISHVHFHLIQDIGITLTRRRGFGRSATRV